MKETTDLQLLDEIIKDIRHKLKRKEICRKYREKNKEKVCESRKKWKEKNKERIPFLQRLRRERIRKEKGIEKYHKPLTKNSPFIRVFTNVKNSRQKCFITVDDVREQYEKQNGICALSGLTIRIPKSSGDRCSKTPDMISVDRIDSGKPYMKGNIQIVCVALNYAKNTFTNEEIQEFLSRIKSI